MTDVVFNHDNLTYPQYQETMRRGRRELTVEEKAEKYEIQRNNQRRWSKNWAEKNPDRFKQMLKTYYEANKAEINKQTVARRRQRREAIKAETTG